MTTIYKSYKLPSATKQEPPEDEPNPTKGLEYKLSGGLGMFELEAAGVVAGDDEDKKLPPGR